MRILPLKALYPNMDFITSNDSFFDSVKEAFSDHLANGFFHATDKEAIYVYRIKGRERSYTGLIANIDIRDYLEGRIKKHEQTLNDKEQMQIQLLMKRNAIVKPVLLGYPRIEIIEQWLDRQCASQQPFLEVFFEREAERHSLWQIEDKATIAYLQKLFIDQVPFSYIADGHHRTTIYSLLHQYRSVGLPDQRFDRLLCALFSSDQLEILNFNRVIDGLRDFSPAHLMAKIGRLFKIKLLKQPAYPRKKHEMVLFMNREWFRLKWRKRVLRAYKDQKVVLDTMLLNEKVLGEILGIEDVRTDARIEYVEGPLGWEGLRQKTLQNEHNIGFCLYPIQWDELTLLVDSGEVLPPKSTWFEPRMKNGLLVYTFS